MSIGNFWESLSQAILVGIILVGRLGVLLESGSSASCRCVLLQVPITTTLRGTKGVPRKGV